MNQSLSVITATESDIWIVGPSDASLPFVNDLKTDMVFAMAKC